MDKKHVIVALGLNNSNDQAQLIAEIESIFNALSPFKILKQSSLYTTPAFPKGSGPDFVNAAVLLNTELPPETLLQNLHQIEAEFGRTRPYRWAPRSCDLDLLFYNQLILPSREEFMRFANFTTKQAIANTPSELILPHPRLHERAFVLGPVREIAPDFVHPIYDLSVEELWEKLPQDERDEIRKIT